MKKLQRTLSLPGAIAVSIGGMLSGIFVLPGLAVGITGSSVWLAFLVAPLYSSSSTVKVRASNRHA